MHPHAFCPHDIAVPAVAYHQRLAQLGLGSRKGKMENSLSGLQNADIVGKHHFLEVMPDTRRLHLPPLQLMEAIGQDIKVVLAGQILQYFPRVRHQLGFGRNHRKEVCGKTPGQSGIVHAYRLQGIEETLPVQAVFRHLAIGILRPQLAVAALVQFVEMLKRPEITTVAVLVVHFPKSAARIFRKSPQSIIKVEKQILVHEETGFQMPTVPRRIPLLIISPG